MRERLTLDLRDQRRIDIVARWRGGALDTTEAVALLGCSERTAWRLRGRFTAAGAGGLVHGNRDRPAANRLPEELRARGVELATGTYAGFNDTHLAEVLERDEGIGIGRSTLARLLRSAGVRPARRRRAPRYRSRRERMPQAGLLVQIDGSPHDWLEGRGPKLTLVGGIDDATGVIVAARFSPSEDGEAYLRLLLAMCRDHGVPAAVYRDRSGIFAPTSSPRGPDDQATQVGRAFAELGIASVAAASPQAKGRIERLWGTCQDRLVSELRLARAATSSRPTGSWRPSCLPSTRRSLSLPRSPSPPGGRPPMPATSSGSAPSATPAGSATTTPSAWRAPSSSCRPPMAGGASPGGGANSSCGWTGASRSATRGGHCGPSRPRPIRPGCAASWSPIPAARASPTASGSDPATRHEPITRGRSGPSHRS